MEDYYQETNKERAKPSNSRSRMLNAPYYDNKEDLSLGKISKKEEKPVFDSMRNNNNYGNNVRFNDIEVKNNNDEMEFESNSYPDIDDVIKRANEFKRKNDNSYSNYGSNQGRLKSRDDYTSSPYKSRVNFFFL